jgi:hypothetical protein
MKILLNILGIITFFLIRYLNRSDKKAEPTLKFWLKDNYEEVGLILLVDLQLMLFALKGGLVIDLDKVLPFLPDGIAIAGDWAICSLIGWFVSWLVYVAIKKKVEEKTNGPV